MSLIRGSLVVLGVSFISMEIAGVVGLIHTFFHYYLLHFLPVLLSLPIAYICFDKLLEIAETRAGLKVTKSVMLIAVLFMANFVFREYMVIIAPVGFNMFLFSLRSFLQGTVPNGAMFYAAVVPQLTFYSVLLIAFTVLLTRRMRTS